MSVMYLLKLEYKVNKEKDTTTYRKNMIKSVREFNNSNILFSLSDSTLKKKTIDKLLKLYFNFKNYRNDSLIFHIEEVCNQTLDEMITNR